jgi:hypothetical protein
MPAITANAADAEKSALRSRAKAYGIFETEADHLIELDRGFAARGMVD